MFPATVYTSLIKRIFKSQPVLEECPKKSADLARESSFAMKKVSQAVALGKQYSFATAKSARLQSRKSSITAGHITEENPELISAYPGQPLQNELEQVQSTP